MTHQEYSVKAGIEAVSTHYRVCHESQYFYTLGLRYLGTGIYILCYLKRYFSVKQIFTQGGTAATL